MVGMGWLLVVDLLAGGNTKARLDDRAFARYACGWGDRCSGGIGIPDGWLRRLLLLDMERGRNLVDGAERLPEQVVGKPGQARCPSRNSRLGAE